MNKCCYHVPSFTRIIHQGRAMYGMCNVHLMSIMEFSYTLPPTLSLVHFVYIQRICSHILICTHSLTHTPAFTRSFTCFYAFYSFNPFHSVPFRFVPSICLFAILLSFINCYHIIKQFYVLCCVVCCIAELFRTLRDL